MTEPIPQERRPSEPPAHTSQLPCTECGWWVTPGHHSEASCHANQMLAGAQTPSVRRWGPEDLDRCQHGRHSIDPCFGCPGGESTGNLFLLEEDHREVVGSDGSDGEPLQVRIGTTYRGEPIYVTPRRTARRETDGV